MECLAHCYRGLCSYIYGYPPRRGSDAADQSGIPKIPPQDKIASKLDLDHEIWISSGVLAYLDRPPSLKSKPRASHPPLTPLLKINPASCQPCLKSTLPSANPAQNPSPEPLPTF